MSNPPFIRPVQKSWWLRQGRYVRYMIREATCLFIALHALIILVGVYRLSQGRESFEAFTLTLWNPGGLIVSVAILMMAVIHSVTWFNLTPKAMPLWIGDKQVPGWIIVAAHYGGWVAVSLLVLFLVGGL